MMLVVRKWTQCSFGNAQRSRDQVATSHHRRTHTALDAASHRRFLCPTQIPKGSSCGDSTNHGPCRPISPENLSHVGSAMWVYTKTTIEVTEARLDFAGSATDAGTLNSLRFKDRVRGELVLDQKDSRNRWQGGPRQRLRSLSAHRSDSGPNVKHFHYQIQG